MAFFAAFKTSQSCHCESSLEGSDSLVRVLAWDSLNQGWSVFVFPSRDWISTKPVNK